MPLSVLKFEGGDIFEPGGIGTLPDSSSSAALSIKVPEQSSQYVNELQDQLAQLNIENQK